MCWQVALPLLASAGGQVIQQKAQNGLLEQQRAEAAANAFKQAQMNREADTRVAQTVQKIAQSNPEAETQAKRVSYLDALRKSSGARAGVQGSPGAVSAAYAQDSADAAAKTEAEAVQDASLQADVEAPMAQRMREGVDLNNTNVDLSLLKNRAAGQDYLSRLRMAMKRPNGGLQAVGGLLSGAGSAMASNAGWASGGGVWDDGSAMSGMPAQARREAFLKGYNPTVRVGA